MNTFVLSLIRVRSSFSVNDQQQNFFTIYTSCLASELTLNSSSNHGSNTVDSMFTVKGPISLFQRFSSQIKSTMSYYAVARGRNPGIYRSWDECKAQTDKFSGALYKKFFTLSEARDFIGRAQEEDSSSSSTNRNSYSSAGRQSQFRQHNTNIMSRAGQDFVYGTDGRVEIYTDGACLSNGYGNAKAGIGVFFNDGHPLNVSEPIYGRATNNNAEIQAVIRALNIAYANDLMRVRINTDSEFLINCINKWMPTWKKRNWTTARGKPVINKVELQELEEALSRVDCVFHHVRGHVGIHGNEMADQLAQRGAEQSDG